MSNHFSVTETGSSGRNRESRARAQVGDLVDVDHIRDTVMITDVDPAKITQANCLEGAQRDVDHMFRFGRGQPGRAMGRDVLVMERTWIPFRGIGQDMMQRVADAGIILLRNRQGL